MTYRDKRLLLEAAVITVLAVAFWLIISCMGGNA